MVDNGNIGIQYIMTQAGVRIAYDGNASASASFKLQANNGNTSNSFIMAQNGSIITYNH
jgi:hypothetical protein